VKITEAWSAARASDDERNLLEIRSSEEPNRIEILNVVAVTRDGNRNQRTFQMERDSSGRLIVLPALETGASFQVPEEAPLFGSRLEWLADVFDPTNA
jgi:hypothetical protein